jgi:hypothetical protein
VGWKDGGRLVQAQGFSAHATLCRDFTDQQTVSRHARSLNLSPWGKVKRKASAGGGLGQLQLDTPQAHWLEQAEAEIKELGRTSAQ